MLVECQASVVRLGLVGESVNEEESFKKAHCEEINLKLAEGRRKILKKNCGLRRWSSTIEVEVERIQMR